jgi:hypothetical protein
METGYDEGSFAVSLQIFLLTIAFADFPSPAPLANKIGRGNILLVLLLFHGNKITFYSGKTKYPRSSPDSKHK